MIAEGFTDEGETVIRAIRDRYDGEKRNLFSEIECGSNYARSMASFALLPIYSGFTFDMTEKHIGFSPRTETGKYLFSVAQSWGTVEFDAENAQLHRLKGFTDAARTLGLRTRTVWSTIQANKKTAPTAVGS